VINSNLDHISHHFRHTAAYRLKLFAENCGQTAADENMVTIDNLQEISSAAHYPMVPSPILYDLLFTHNNARLAYHSALKLLRSSMVMIYISFESQYATSY